MGFGGSVFGLPLDDWRVLVLLATIFALLALAFGFAASATALRVKNIRKAQRWERLEAKWEAVLPEILSGLAQPEALQAQVQPGEELYFVDFLYRQARARNGQERAILSGLARPHLHRVIARFTGGDPERRARAVQTVAVLAFDEHAGRILEALDDPSPLVSMIAARSLARSGRPEYVAAVIERLDRFQDWSPKFLTSMLVSMGPAGVPALREQLASVLQPPMTRAVCADTLRQLGDVESADTAASVISAETDADVLAACLRLLRKLGSPDHLPAMRRLTRSDDFAIRAQAIAALGRLGGPADDTLLRRALDDPSPWVVLHAARALRDRGHGHLLRTLAADRHEHTDIALQVLAEST